MEIKKQLLPIVDNTQESFSMFITKSAWKKTREWCTLLPNNEWSGSLFYTIEGSFETHDLKVKVVDFYVQDIGSSAYTEFEQSPDVVTYMCEHPELMTCYTGLIHSHDTMGVFFSGTDRNTLSEEGESLNHFVSLIVNNNGDRVAKITRQIRKEIVGRTHTSYNSFNNVSVKLEDEDYTGEVETYIEVFNLNIEVEEEESIISKEIMDRYNTLKTKKTSTQSPTIFNSYGKEGTLFNDEDFKWDFKPVKDMPKFTEPTVSKDTITDYIRQLVTGSITINHNSKFEDKKWIEEYMEKIMKKRFPDILDYSNFISAFAEFIIWFSAAADEDVNETSSALASNILEKLEEYKSNVYLDELKRQLSNYII